MKKLLTRIVLAHFIFLLSGCLELSAHIYYDSINQDSGVISTHENVQGEAKLVIRPSSLLSDLDGMGFLIPVYDCTEEEELSSFKERIKENHTVLTHDFHSPEFILSQRDVVQLSRFCITHTPTCWYPLYQVFRL